MFTSSMVAMMTDRRNAVLHDRSGPDEALFHDALIAGLSRVAVQIGRGTLADKARRTTRSLDMLFAGETGIPNAKGAFDFLLADDTALDEVLALYGVKICPRNSAAGGDLAVIAELAHVLARFTSAIEDGKRVHTETLDVAKALRPLMPKLTAIIDEADALRAPTA